MTQSESLDEWETAGRSLAPPPRKVPVAFRLAEVLPFRWWYVWTLLVVAVAPIALWIQLPMAFAVVALWVNLDSRGFQLR